jgi:hypothetical protein
LNTTEAEEDSIEHCEATDYKYKYVYTTGYCENYTKNTNDYEGVRKTKI